MKTQAYYTVRDVMKARGNGDGDASKQAIHQLIRRRGIKLENKIGNVWILTPAQFRRLTEDARGQAKDT